MTCLSSFVVSSPATERSARDSGMAKKPVGALRRTLGTVGSGLFLLDGGFAVDLFDVLVCWLELDPAVVGDLDLDVPGRL
jgi:hypothetical protein